MVIAVVHRVNRRSELAINTRTPEGRAIEVRNAALLTVKRRLQEATSELEYLIGATPTGERRDVLCDCNIHVGAARELADKLQSEESP